MKILHLEDNFLDAELISEMIQAENPSCDILRVDCESEFLDALENFAPNLILSDYSLPDFDGLRAFEFAHQHSPYLPFIMLTGALGEEVAVEILKKGVTDYVLKQRLELLYPAICRAIQEADDRKERQRAEAEIHALNTELQARLQELEQTKGALEHALNAQRTFLAETSHELRTPITALLGYLRRAAREAHETHDATNASIGLVLDDATRVATSMSRLVNDLLQLSRGELVQEYIPHYVLLSKIAEEVARDHNVHSDVQPHLEIIGDPARLQQMLHNLVSNAVRICHTPDKVCVRAYLQDTDVYLEVVDQGPGVPDEIKKRIFDKFYRGKEAGSAGLGLTISQQIAHTHQSAITVHDTIGGGATFRVIFPALEEEDE